MLFCCRSWQFFWVVTLGGLYAGMRHHGQPWAFGLGLLSALVLFAFLFINIVIAYVSLVGLIVASGLSIGFRSRQLKLSDESMKR